MTWRLIVKEEAVQDIRHAYQFYEQEQVGLGDRFLSALSDRFTALTEHPGYYSFIDDRNILRDVAVNAFPFVIIFEVSGEEVIVYAVCSTYRQH